MKFGSVIILERKKKLTLAEGFAQILNGSIKEEDRLKCFIINGTKCACCGIEAEFFALEDTESNIGKRTTLNLYAIRNGKDVFFTKDHIIPKSKGGLDSLDNYQTMCWECNSRKGNTLV